MENPEYCQTYDKSFKGKHEKSHKRQFLEIEQRYETNRR